MTQLNKTCDEEVRKLNIGPRTIQESSDAQGVEKGRKRHGCNSEASKGFRAIHCKTCSVQERCLRNHCQCNKVWHHCAVHRIDPPYHRSRKAPKKTPDEKKKHEEEQKAKMQRSRKRKAKLTPPIIDDSVQEIRGRRGHTNKAAKQRAYKLKGMRQGAMHIKPDTEVIARIRTRIRDKVKQDTDSNATEDAKDVLVFQAHKETSCDEKGGAPETVIEGEQPISEDKACLRLITLPQVHKDETGTQRRTSTASRIDEKNQAIRNPKSRDPFKQL